MTTELGVVRRKTLFYVQPVDGKTVNYLKTALPENNPKRYPKEGISGGIASEHPLYLVPHKDVELFIGVGYLSFNVFTRKQEEPFPVYKMCKCQKIEERNKKAVRPKCSQKFKLVKKTKACVKKQNLPTAIVKAKMSWNTYVVIPQDNRTITVTVNHIRKALQECGLSTQSVNESGKIHDDTYEYVWEADGNTLFRLWRFARENSLIRFLVYKTSSDGIFANFQQVFHYPKGDENHTEGKILQYKERNP